MRTRQKKTYFQHFMRLKNSAFVIPQNRLGFDEPVPALKTTRPPKKTPYFLFFA
jgi:hypothetical protein